VKDEGDAKFINTYFPLHLTTILLLMVILIGCRTAAPQKNQLETEEDVDEALESIADAVSGKQLSEEEMSNFKKQLRTDTETQSAVQTITDTISGKDLKVKYCPVTGKRYAYQLQLCPIHNVELKVVED
jgi:hypothetical protein